MHLFGMTETDRSGQWTAERLTGAAFSQFANFDGGEAPLGRAIRNLMWRKAEATPFANQSQAVRDTRECGYVRDGGIQPSWNFALR